jgi:pyruvate kinase
MKSMQQGLRRTKILATLGPASESSEIIEQLIQAGADGFRLNFSHSNHEKSRQLIVTIREVSKKVGKAVAILQDLQGPKIRVGTIKDHGPVQLVAGEKLTITTREIEGTKEIISTTYKNLATDVKPGDRILIDDGSIELRVLSVTPTDVETLITSGGLLKEKKGINLPGVPVSAPSMTEKDYADARFGVEMGVDYIALSFVRTASDVLCLKTLIAELNSDIRVVAKIEKPEGVQNLNEILSVADGVMVARGDLGVEIAAEKVPLLQKMIIEKANKAEKLVITATQMLESMVQNPKPTRAEASDVANAILDGTDVVMLSQETAIGMYPVKSVQTMASIALFTESDEQIFAYHEHIRPEHLSNFTSAIVHAARTAAIVMEARAMIVITQTGLTAHLASCQRPPCPIFAFTTALRTHQYLALVWGVYPLVFDSLNTTEEIIKRAEEMLLERKLINAGEVVVIVSGTSPVRGATNMMKIERIGAE